MRKILNPQVTRELALGTITEIAGIVKSTLGPGGNVVIIQQSGQNPDGSPRTPLITKDGVTCAESITFRNPAKNTIAQAIIQVAKNTVNSAGDGPQPLYSKVLTPKGFVRMGDLKVGDEICGTNGSFQKVLGIFPKGSKEIYEVELAGGKIVECCADHLWSVVDTANEGTSRVLTTSELIENYVKHTPDGYLRHKYYVPITSVEFYQNDSEMPLDPYLVGVLLGDGSLSGSGSIEISLGKQKEHIIDKLRLPEGINMHVTYVDDKNYFRVKLSGKNAHGKGIKDIVNSIGLLGSTSDSKFIPKSYLYASKKTREALLQGLLDTDGHINRRGLFEFSTVSAELANDFIDLTRSLGKVTHTRLHERSADEGSYSSKPIHRITELRGYVHGDKIVRIEPKGKFTEMQCILVSNTDHLYVTDGYVVTHNTTTSLVLAEALYQSGYIHLKQGENGIELYNALRAVKDHVIEQLQAEVTEVAEEDLVNVARISANGDEEVAQLVSKAILAVGEDGHIDLQEGYARETVLELVEGAMYKQGWRKFGPLGALMVNDKVRNVCELEKPAVLTYAGDIKDINELAKFLENLYGKDEQSGAFKDPIPTLIIAYDFSDDVKNAIIQLKVQAKIPIAAIKAPFDGSPNARTQMLEDLACLLGGQVTARGIIDLKDVGEEHLGCAGRVVIGAEEVVFYDGEGKEEAVLQRVDDLKTQLSDPHMIDYDKQNVRLRIGKLTGGIAVIKVGGDSELEMKERKDRIEDSLCAVKVAITEGILPGGGYSLYAIAQELEATTTAETIMKEALQAPIKQIIRNIGKNPEVILSHMPEGQGYDARNKKYVNLMEAGIVDPLKVVKSALENAVSIVGLLLTTGGAIVADTESKDGQPNPLAALMGMS